MGRASALLITALAATLVYMNTSALPIPARIWTTVLVALLPPMSILQARALRGMTLPSPMSLYAQSAMSLWLLAGATALVARSSELDAATLGVRALPLAPTLVWTGALTAGGVLLVLTAHRLGVRESPTLAGLLPRTSGERVAFLGLSLTAGICEELVFRGFLIPALATTIGSVWLAAGIAAAVFGLIHAYQGFAGAVRAAALGALLSTVLVATGSLVPAVIAHAAIDVIGGFWLGPRLID